jgi:cytochrome oxidase Cu insertion factor (SCO1/SenC/PrrC family)
MQDDRMIGRLRALALAALLAAAALTVLVVARQKTRNSGLEHLGAVPAFHLTAADGRPFDGAQLAGKVWVASFVYSTCKTSCPMLQSQMMRISKGLPAGDAYALVSVTVDPAKDTPQALLAYAKKLGVDDPRWAFLTGSPADIKALVVGGFKLAALPAEAASDKRPDPEIIHSSRLALVDKHGQIRGYYDGLLSDSVSAIRNDAQRLARED